MLFISLLLLMIGLIALRLNSHKKHFRPHKIKATKPQRTLIIRHPKKPEWVMQEVIRLKALMPKLGCRKIAQQFNRLHSARRGQSVSKSHVANVIKHHQYAILQKRKHLKHQRPKPVPIHTIWATDLTHIKDEQSHQHVVVGIIEHGSRALLALQRVQTKASIQLLKGLISAIETTNYQIPQYLRTDNETVFTSKLFRFGLWVLNIKHQTTETMCPWQNGKIERLFGTLKITMSDLLFSNGEAIQQNMQLFKFWYNHIRTHEHLNGQTPFEAYNQQPIAFASRQKPPDYFTAWHGALSGYWFR